MTDAERQAFIAGWEAARKATWGLLSVVQPRGEAQERYQRLVVAAVNSIVCPHTVNQGNDDPEARERFEALRERVQPKAPPPEEYPFNPDEEQP